MDFTHSRETLRRIEDLTTFIDERVRPNEVLADEQRFAAPATQPPIIESLKAEAKEAGLWNLCVRDPFYGHGLTMVEYAPLAEVLGTSALAQEVTNCDAPSSVNGDALAGFATEEQRERWLEPQLYGLIRSAFAMTEPDVASSDATNISMTARRDGDDWVLSGRKWWISGVLHPNCAFVIAVAATDPDGPRHRRHSQFIVPIDAPGFGVGRNLTKFGYADANGHCELVFDDVRVPGNALLGEVGAGFAIAAARLGPARVQHCMRTIGLAELALTLMCQRAEQRVTFGQTVASRANVGDWIAEARIDIDAARLLTLRTASIMDTEGDKAAAAEMSIIKVQVMRTATTVIDRAIQVFGAAGVSQDTPLARMYAQLRSLRIADGPDEVHLMAIARREQLRQAEQVSRRAPD